MKDMTLGQRIAECRKKKGLSQEALGEKLGVSRQAISKWEADGTVPEVDKLIGMSRLFGVSVGWLLGIEEEAPPEQKPEISEELLRKIEEIVLRYRPRKQPMSTKKKVLIGIAVVLVLCVGGSWLSRWKAESIVLGFTQAQVENINEQNANIQSQLNQLASRLDDMANKDVEKLLSNCSFELDVWVDRPGVNAIFSAVPKSWKAGDSAYLVVQVPDGTGIRQDCTWDSTFLTAPLSLEAVDGYKFCFTVVHEDGTMEQQMLSDWRLENLARELTIGCEVTEGGAVLQKVNGALTMYLADYDIHIFRPSIAEDNEKFFWKRVDFYLYRCTEKGQELIGTYDLLKPEQDSEIRKSNAIWFTPYASFSLEELEDGDGLELWVRAEMENGMYAIEMAGSWAYNNGELIASVPVE